MDYQEKIPKGMILYDFCLAPIKCFEIKIFKRIHKIKSTKEYYSLLTRGGVDWMS